MGNELLVMKNITKVYGNGVLSNENVNFSVDKGEIHALLGENGAGKSTLMKILFGIETADRGEVFLKGEKVKITSPNEAIKHAIGMVHQHFKLVNSFTVAENVVLGNEPRRGIFIKQNECLSKVEELSKKYNFNLDPSAVVENLSVGKKQKIEILKTLYRGAELIILDEPTAVLTPQEVAELFEQLKSLRSDGFTIIFISHHLNEVLELCDRFTVLRSGKTIGTYSTEGMTEQEMSRLMVGRDVVLEVNKAPAKPTETVLEVDSLSYINDENKKVMLDKVSLKVRKGEIVGIAGLEGSGQRELVEIITGLSYPAEGVVKLNGQDIKGMSIQDIREKGLSYIPEDRIKFGSATTASIKENLLSNRLKDSNIAGKFFLKNKNTDKLADELIKEYLVKCRSSSVPVGMLSGGNMQKVVVAREFSVNPKILIAEQPTRGVDVGAIEFIHKKLVEIRDSGTAVLLITADLNEVLELSDSVIVMNEGKIAAYFEDSHNLTEEELGFYMLGIKKQTEQTIGGNESE
ncbi:MAG: ABC transporter ATP-binding protein [Oscillospiraceae bacterium]